MTAGQTVVYISHAEHQCGVYQFGRRIGEALQRSAEFQILYRECSNEADLEQILETDHPDAVIYNYHPSTMSWLTGNVTRRISVPQIGTIHEVTQAVADQSDNWLFDYHVAPDPTLLLKNPIVFKTGRLVAAFRNELPAPDQITIGSFGFGTDGKGLEYLISTVQHNFDNACIRLHLPSARFGDTDGTRARAIADRCRALIYKPGITLQATYDFLDEDRLLQFLAGNTCNVFVYNRADGRGISSALDYALGVQRPVAIRRTTMMRHLQDAIPSICLEDRSLKEIIASGTAPIRHFADDWCEANLIWDYNRMLRTVLGRPLPPRHLRGFGRRVIRKVLRITGLSATATAVTPTATEWTSGTIGSQERSGPPLSEKYKPVDCTDNLRLNRILDQSARDLYRRTVADLFRWLPDLMARKIPEANIQQAFTLDTVVRLIPETNQNPRILCVGSFEDSAAYGLKRLGYHIDEVDPVINYNLAEFLTRPTTQAESYDIIFSVSVIEHVQDDETFLCQIAGLLKKGGYAVLTCDYLDGYREGDPKPDCDWRFYTQHDIRSRLLPRIPDCRLVDDPSWDCDAPDFHWNGYTYTFAGIVFQKLPPRPRDI